MVVIRVDEFKWQYADPQLLADLLYPASITSHSVTSKQGFSTKEGISGSFKRKFFGSFVHGPAIGMEPLLKVGFLALALCMHKASKNCLFAVDYCRIGRKY